jgi:hypothetical protein
MLPLHCEHDFRRNMVIRSATRLEKPPLAAGTNANVLGKQFKPSREQINAN